MFGPPLQRWHVHRVIPGRAKLLAVATMAVSVSYLSFFTDLSHWIKVSTVLVMLYGAGYILSRPSTIPAEAVPTDEG